MAIQREKPESESTEEPEVTALVSQRDMERAKLAERQQALLERLHRGLRAVSPSYPQLNAVWIELRGKWSWLVVVPGEPDCSTTELARALAHTGSVLSVQPIDFIDAKGLDLPGSTRLVARFGMFDEPETAAPRDGADGRDSFDGQAQPVTKTVVALESPLANPLALPVALAADGVVLCVRRGRDRIAAVRDTIRAIGPERILCCVLVD